jgi:ABC-type uncharacterized transport system permease subunit
MDLYKTLFWIGFIILLVSHIQLIRDAATRQHAMIALTGLVFMFVGSKIGRDFLGIKA